MHLLNLVLVGVVFLSGNVIAATETSSRNKDAHSAGVVHQRKELSYSWHPATLTHGAVCGNGGGQTVYLNAHQSLPLRVGICKWTAVSSGNQTIVKNEFQFFSFPNGEAVNFQVGCEVPGRSLYRVAWSDVDDGYEPSPIEDSEKVLVELTSSDPRWVGIQNNHATKDVLIDFTLGKQAGFKTLTPHEMTYVSSYKGSKYIVPYRHGEFGAPCD